MDANHACTEWLPVVCTMWLQPGSKLQCALHFAQYRTSEEHAFAMNTDSSTLLMLSVGINALIHCMQSISHTSSSQQHYAWHQKSTSSCGKHAMLHNCSQDQLQFIEQGLQVHRSRKCLSIAVMTLTAAVTSTIWDLQWLWCSKQAGNITYIYIQLYHAHATVLLVCIAGILGGNDVSCWQHANSYSCCFHKSRRLDELAV